MTPAGTNVNEGDPMHNVNVQAVEQTAARATAGGTRGGGRTGHGREDM